MNGFPRGVRREGQRGRFGRHPGQRHVPAELAAHRGTIMKRIGVAVSLITWLCAAWPAVGAEKPMIVELWPGKVPDETGNIAPEKVRMSPKFTRKEVEV